ncbi:MAG: hypothetical protein C4533_00315 [Candidatus Omnitrophota bacterium]|jgi:proteasome assembly chaperone (PAC2) family protein|nr:MAG: hypothetical protein C4533_00315 [Candidatus Omnitrophota bacterium]
MANKIKLLKKPKLKNPYLIVAWPGIGEVAFKAATYLVEQLKATEFAEMEAEEFFYLTGSVIRNGIMETPQLPYNKFYYWKNKTGSNDLIIFISNAQPDLSRGQDYCQEIIDLAKSFKVKMVIGFAAMPQPIEHTQQPGVRFACTSAKLNNEMKKHGFTTLPEGQISGMNGLFLGIAKREGLEGVSFLGEVPLYTIQIENPKASYAILDALNRILRISLDFTALIEQMHAVDEEINKLLDYLKIGTQASGPINEDEIEKIKKTLGQLTKLPFSVKEKIDKLFSLAKNDIAKAQELKNELDKWNVYKDYEDRFLDLFRKDSGADKEKDN